MQSNSELTQQIEATAKLLNIDEYVIEKDYFLTNAIRNVINVNNENYRLIFQGGTSLSKAYNIINRMSEDSDFRVELINNKIASKEQKKKLLKEFRKSIIAELKNNSFKINDQDIEVFNEGRYMSIKATYPSIFPHTKHIKPFLAMDFFLGNVRTETERKNITTIIKQTLHDKVDHPATEVECISILETAAEKWVALTRRIANISYRSNYNDPSLVRHLYDIYYINKNNNLIKNNNFNSLVEDIIKHDKDMFKTHNDAYYQNPDNEIKRALTELEANNIWQENWNEFIDAMVFNKKAPLFKEAMQLFLDLSNDIINYSNFKKGL